MSRRTNTSDSLAEAQAKRTVWQMDLTATGPDAEYIEVSLCDMEEKPDLELQGRAAEIVHELFERTFGEVPSCIRCSHSTKEIPA